MLLSDDSDQLSSHRCALRSLADVAHRPVTVTPIRRLQIEVTSERGSDWTNHMIREDAGSVLGCVLGCNNLSVRVQLHEQSLW
jgi:hypothetical protein